MKCTRKLFLFKRSQTGIAVDGRTWQCSSVRQSEHINRTPIGVPKVSGDFVGKSQRDGEKGDCQEQRFVSIFQVVSRVPNQLLCFPRNPYC